MGNIVLGSTETFASFETVSIRICKLDNNRILVLHVKGSDSRPYGTIYDIDAGGNRTHVVTQLLWDQDVGGHWSYPIDCCQIDTNKFLVSYVDGTGNRYRRARLLTVSGSTITEHGQLLGAYQPQRFPTVEQIALNKFVYSNCRLTVNGNSFLGTCSGTTITWGDVDIGQFSPLNSIYYIRNTKLADNKWVVTFKDTLTVYCIVGTTGSGYDAAGRVISYGSQYALHNVDGKYIDACSPDTDKFVVSYRDDVGTNGYIIVCTVSGKIVTKGTPVEFDTNVVNTACCSIDTDHILVSYRDSSSGNVGKVILFNIDWGNRTASQEDVKTFETGSTGGASDLGLDIILVNSSLFQIAYQDDADNDYGKIINGKVSILPIPNAPINFSVIPGPLSNTASWDDVSGAVKYNLYWKKDKCPNEYFTTIDNWSFSSNEVGETATISSNKLLLDIPDSINAQGVLKYNFLMHSEDFISIIDFVAYTPDASTGCNTLFRVGNSANTDLIYIQYWLNGSTHNIRSRAYINSVTTTVNTTSSNKPTQFKIERDGDLLKTYYYDNGWTLVQSIDFSTRSSLLDEVMLQLYSNSDRGGSCKFDNLITTPSIKDSGTKIIDVTSPHSHTSLLESDVYCYEVTAENIDEAEGEASLEEFGIPTYNLPAPPEITGIGDDSQNTINISEIWNATKYNIYWSLVPSVTKENGTKIENVTRPYEHIDLIRQNYYYVVTAENAEFEGNISNEIYLKPDFDGKIFNHIDIIISRLLYQYKIKE